MDTGQEHHQWLQHPSLSYSAPIVLPRDPTYSEMSTKTASESSSLALQGKKALSSKNPAARDTERCPHPPKKKGKEESAHSRDPSLPSFLEKGSLSGPPQAPKGVVGTKEKRRCLQEGEGGLYRLGEARSGASGATPNSSSEPFRGNCDWAGRCSKGQAGPHYCASGALNSQSQRWPAHPQHQRSRPHPSAPAFSHPLG